MTTRTTAKSFSAIIAVGGWARFKSLQVAATAISKVGFSITTSSFGTFESLALKAVTLKTFKKIPFLNTIKRIIVSEECEQWTWGAAGSYLKVAAKQHVISTHTHKGSSDAH